MQPNVAPVLRHSWCFIPRISLNSIWYIAWSVTFGMCTSALLCFIPRISYFLMVYWPPPVCVLQLQHSHMFSFQGYHWIKGLSFLPVRQNLTKPCSCSSALLVFFSKNKNAKWSPHYVFFSTPIMFHSKNITELYMVLASSGMCSAALTCFISRISLKVYMLVWISCKCSTALTFFQEYHWKYIGSLL